MTIDELFVDFTKKAEEILSHYKLEIGKIRTGRASPSLVENLRVEYYGALTPLNQVASIKVPEARLLVIEPWDKNVIGSIEKAITTSELGLAPSSDGQVVRIAIPSLTEERRKEFSKLVSKYAEEAKAAIRNLRNKTKEHIEELGYSEDETFRQEKKMQDEVEKYQVKIEEIKDKKISEILAI